MKKIKLTQGKVAIVDDADFEMVSSIKWCAMKNRNVWYAINGSGKNKKFMHRFILGAEPGIMVDHKDGNGLHNFRSNMRTVTHSQNGANRKPWKNKSSKYLGVYKMRNKYQAASRKDGKLHIAGMFENEVDAAKAYNKLAKQLHGQFAKLNPL